MLNAVKELGRFIFPGEYSREQTGAKDDSTSASQYAPRKRGPGKYIPLATLSPLAELESHVDPEGVGLNVASSSDEFQLSSHSECRLPENLENEVREQTYPAILRPFIWYAGYLSMLYHRFG